MEYLAFTIMTWLSINYDLRIAAELPDFEIVPTSQLEDLWISRSGYSTTAGGRNAANAKGKSSVDAIVVPAGQKALALYDEPTRLVYLTDEWRPDSPAHTSILVHELVHHLQQLEGVEFSCPQAREKIAYEAQSAWLEMFDTTIEEQGILADERQSTWPIRNPSIGTGGTESR